MVISGINRITNELIRKEKETDFRTQEGDELGIVNEGMSAISPE